MKVICAWCNKVMRDESPGNNESSSEISHGLCPDCKAALLADNPTALDEFLNALNEPVLLVDGDGVVSLANKSALQLVDKPLSQVRGFKGGDVFECVFANLPGGCGQTVHCTGCAIRLSVTRTHRTGQSLTRVPATLNVVIDDRVDPVRFLISTEKAGHLILLRIDQLNPPG